MYIYYHAHSISHMTNVFPNIIYSSKVLCINAQLKSVKPFCNFTLVEEFDKKNTNLNGQSEMPPTRLP